MSEEKNIRTQFSLEELQIDLANVAFRLAELSELIGRRLGPQNALFASPDPYYLGREMDRIRLEMMDLTGKLLGEE